MVKSFPEQLTCSFYKNHCSQTPFGCSHFKQVRLYLNSLMKLTKYVRLLQGSKYLPPVYEFQMRSSSSACKKILSVGKYFWTFKQRVTIAAAIGKNSAGQSQLNFLSKIFN